jgi:hypothetical protein
MQLIKMLELRLLLSLANGTLLFATRLLGSSLSYPVDGCILFIDRKRLLGDHRGVMLAILVTAAGSVLFDLDGRRSVL